MADWPGTPVTDTNQQWPGTPVAQSQQQWPGTPVNAPSTPNNFIGSSVESIKAGTKGLAQDVAETVTGFPQRMREATPPLNIEAGGPLGRLTGAAYRAGAAALTSPLAQDAFDVAASTGFAPLSPGRAAVRGIEAEAKPAAKVAEPAPTPTKPPSGLPEDFAVPPSMGRGRLLPPSALEPPAMGRGQAPETGVGAPSTTPPATMVAQTPTKPPAASVEAPGGISPQSVGAARAPKAAREPGQAVTRVGDVDPMDKALRQKEMRQAGMVIDMGKELQARPPELLANEMKLYQLGEGNPEMQGNPELQKLYEQHIEPLKDDVYDLHREARMASAKLDIGEKAMEALDMAYDPNHMPRIRTDLAREFPELAPERMWAEQSGERPFGVGVRTPGAVEDRRYYVLQNAAGERELVYWDGKNEMRGVTSGESYSWRANSKTPEPGQSVGDMRVQTARTDEIEAATPERYIKDASVALQLTKMKLTRYLDDLAFAQNTKQNMIDRGIATMDAAKGRNLGYKTTNLPGFANLHVDPRVAASMERFGPPRDGEDFTAWFHKANRALTRTLFVLPIAHTRNVLELYLQDKNLSLLNPMRTAGMTRSIRRAYTEVTGGKQVYMDVLRHGGALWSRSEKIKGIYQNIQKEVQELQGSPGAKSLAATLNTSAKNLLGGIFGNWSHQIVGIAQDTMIMARVLERMETKLPGEINYGSRGAYEANLQRAIDETYQILPDYFIPTEVPHPEMLDRLADKFKVTKGLPSKAARFPSAASEDPFGRAVFNFARWNYNKTRAALGPAVRAAQSAAKVVKYGKGKKGLEEYDRAVANVLRLTAVSLGTMYAMPYLDGFVRRNTKDQTARATRAGSTAVIQALDDLYHGRHAPWEEQAMAGLGAFSPAAEMFADTVKHQSGERVAHYPERGNRPDTFGEFAGKIGEEIPVVSMFARPWRQQVPLGQRVTNEAIQQTIGYGHEPKPIQPRYKKMRVK